MKSFLILCLLFINFSASAQVYNSPYVKKSTDPSLTIKSIQQANTYTQINFIFNNTSAENVGIYLAVPGDKDSYFIRIGSKIYDLLYFQNISNRVNGTIVKPKEQHSFFARFEKIPNDVISFDLIEGEDGPWDFNGISFQKPRSLPEESIFEEPGRFRKDYQYYSFYDIRIDKWEDLKSGDNTFVFNYNDNADILHLKSNGEKILYKNLSGVTEGKTDSGEEFQSIQALDEDGNTCTFKLFNDSSSSIQIIWEFIAVYFTN